VPPTPYGYCLTPKLHRLLRAAPPPRALRWVEEVVGPGARVRWARALRGGESSAIHGLGVETRGGEVHRFVLRRFVLPDWLAEEPEAPVNEATGLEVAARGAVPTPRLVAVDPTGEAAGDPAVLMMRLRGRIDWDPPDLETYLRRLAEPLPAVHAIAPDPRVQPYDPYELHLDRPPRWARQPDVWTAAMEVFHAPPPSTERRFIHRDYHPGNVLWARGRVTGLVDWVNASIGVPEADVGHCRTNLAGHFDQATADRFLALYQAITGRREYHPYWDIVAALGGQDLEVDDDPDLANEAFLAAAVARL
jgi:aminoglycoside phosphotransferase (APT) family kinase protein